ncbi:MAG: ribonuclease [Sphingopyxis macrogoltabida]|uniref:Ribonuclease n=1 Tax=Sphingopyxis macrogoltabida TaxID=33050 RepID=A0A2W5MR66_SPHMC|nr:MAG: ribonuclease [Sphingopyxis macrogoltabida]
MAEWLFEAGVGEARAALVDQDRILEARIEREGEGPRVGAVLDARLVEPARVLLDAPGEPVATLAAAPRLPLGTRLRVEVVRMALRERGRDKPARARVAAADAALGPGPDLRSRIAATGHGVVDLTAYGPDRLEAAGWSERIDHARTGHWPFPGGALWIDPTPAMLMIDIDGDGGALALARAGGMAAIDVIRCCDIGGAIGIDFPTLPGRAERQAIDTLLDESLPQPFQRTAVNGFGFVQIVRRRERPSLVEQLQFDSVATDAALLLRQAERAVGTGPLQLTARPAVVDHIAARPEWTAELGRRTGRAVDLRADAATKGTGHAQ